MKKKGIKRMDQEPLFGSTKHDTVKSHIQIPKCVLRQFEVNGRFYIYDVASGIIKRKGHAASFNTKKGYYSSEAEQYLSNNIEGPIGNLLKEIAAIDMSSDNLTEIPYVDKTIKNYIYALLCRDPGMQEKINENSLFYRFFPEQIRNDFSTVAGIETAREQSIFSDYTATLVFNRTNIPFVLPALGICAAHSLGFKNNLIPISPIAAGTLISNTDYEKHVGTYKVLYFSIDDANTIKEINKETIQLQIRTGRGMIVSPSKEILEEALK